MCIGGGDMPCAYIHSSTAVMYGNLISGTCVSHIVTRTHTWGTLQGAAISAA